MERDTFMDPEEAKSFGLIDEVVESRPELPENTQSSQDKNKDNE